jgi:glutaredoxin
MQEITMFYLDDCGYCHKAHRALEELYEKNPEYRKIPITKIEESRQPEVADRYDYWAVPTFFVGDRKVFEAHIGMSYEAIHEKVQEALDQAMQ